MKKLLLTLITLLTISCTNDNKTASESLNRTSLLTTTNPKKGVGLAESTFGVTQLNDLNVSWYYNWGLNTSVVSTKTFVPMCYSDNRVSSVYPTSTLLGFNEPDNVSQSDMTVVQAISNWPTLVSKSTRIGSPATASNPLTSGSWLTGFMTYNPKPKVDFVCVHWYKGCDVNKFKSDMTAIINLYQKPIWVTEFAPQTTSSSQSQPTKYTQAQINTFLTQVIAWMNTNPKIEKYAYHDSKYGRCALFTSAGVLTTTGITYKNLN
jgi:hypothetical protein